MPGLVAGEPGRELGVEGIGQLGDVAPETACQFERLGFFVADRLDSAPGQPVFNRTVTLRDSWTKAAGK